MASKYERFGATQRNELFELINRLPAMLDLVEKAQEAISELESKYPDDEEQKRIEKINKHLDWLGEYYIKQQKEAAIKYRKIV
jgi:RNA binding exosome subunit